LKEKKKIRSVAMPKNLHDELPRGYEGRKDPQRKKKREKGTPGLDKKKSIIISHRKKTS